MLRNRVILLVGNMSPLAAAIGVSAARQDGTLVVFSSAEKEASELMITLRAERREGFYVYVRYVSVGRAAR